MSDTAEYNNMMYEVLSYLPTVLLPSKPSLAQYVQENIFAPLGMNSTTYSFARANATGNLADGFGREGDPTMNPLENTVTHALPFWFQVGGDEGNCTLCSTLHTIYVNVDAVASGPGGVISTITDIVSSPRALLLSRSCLKLDRPPGLKC